MLSDHKEVGLLPDNGKRTRKRRLKDVRERGEREGKKRKGERL